MTQQQVIKLLKLKLEGKTQAALAREIGVSGPFLHDVLNGQRKPGPKVLTYLGLTKKEDYEEAS